MVPLARVGSLCDTDEPMDGSDDPLDDDGSYDTDDSLDGSDLAYDGTARILHSIAEKHCESGTVVCTRVALNPYVHMLVEQNS